jgi:hypothetical protein
VYIPHIGGRVVKSPKAIPKKKPICYMTTGD